MLPDIFKPLHHGNLLLPQINVIHVIIQKTQVSFFRLDWLLSWPTLFPIHYYTLWHLILLHESVTTTENLLSFLASDA
jgi:hypothetical protein